MHMLILSYTDARRDPRVLRQIRALRGRYPLTVAGLGDPGLDGVRFLPIARSSKKSVGEAFRALCLLLGINGPARRRFALTNPSSDDARYDLVICNDAEPLPLAFSMAGPAPVLFDAHEYYPLEFESSFRWRLLMRRHLTALCRQFIPRCAAMTTVSQGIAERYRSVFGARPVVILSAPDFQDAVPSPAVEGRVRLVHHGAANRDRGLERMIDAVPLLDGRFSLDLYLVGDPAYVAQLKDRAAGEPRIVFRRPVPMTSLATMLNEYDMGLCFFTDSTFNLRHCLPNKFFECVQARLGIAVCAHSEEMGAIVREHGLGIVAENFTPQCIADALNSLTAEDVSRFKRNAHAAARIYNSENEMEKLRGIVKNLLQGGA